MVQAAFRWDKNCEVVLELKFGGKTLKEITMRLPPGLRTQTWINL